MMAVALLTPSAKCYLDCRRYIFGLGLWNILLCDKLLLFQKQRNGFVKKVGFLKKGVEI